MSETPDASRTPRKAERSLVRPTANCSSGLPIVALGVLAVAAGVRHSSALSAALGAALLIIPLAVYAILKRSVRGARVARVAPECVFEGDAFDVEVYLHNGSRIPLFHPRVIEAFVPEAYRQREVLFPSRVVAGEVAEARYRADCIIGRGRYALGPVELCVSDPFGWFQARVAFPAQGSLKVYPRFQPFGAPEKSGESHSVLIEDSILARVGESSEFFSVREYRIGDPLKRVHWPLTAHRGYPVVREPARNAAGELRIVIDLHRDAFLGFGRGSSLEQGIKIAAALSAHALRRGHSVGILTNGPAAARIPKASSPGQLRCLLDALAEVKPDGPAPLDEFLERCRREVPPGSTCVVTVSPYVRESARLTATLTALRRSGVRIVLVVYHDATYRNLYETRQDHAPVEVYVARARRLGFETFVVHCGANLPSVFRVQGAGR